MTTKGPWIFILIVQINCFHLHTNRWSESKDVASSFLLLLLFFFFFWPEKTHRCYGKQFLSLSFFFFQTLREKKRGQRVTCKCPEFEMLSARRSQTVSARYLNISGPRAERVQGCSLTSLCEPSAASDSQKREPGNNYSVSPGLGIRQGKASHPDTPLLFFFFFLKRMLN